MKTNLFDLTGKECFCCAESRGSDNVQKITAIPLHSLLIYPRNSDVNKSPYLQNPMMPTIEDFYTEDGKFDFSKSFFLSGMLAGDIIDEKREHLQKYFNSQLGILPEFDSSNSNILLVPDDYDSEKQEKLLRSCGLPRNKTLLLWRSVAICLGAEEELIFAGVKEGDKIAIVDAQSSGCINISILTMRYDGTKLVPARSSFNKKENYPVVNERTNCLKINTLNNDKMVVDKGREFWRHTWQRNGEFYVPDGNSWKKRTFEKYRRHYPGDLSCSLKNKIDFYVITGEIQIDFIKYLNPTKVIREKVERNYALMGAGRFSVRNAKGLPTYFDECESLYFIVQDLNEEKIVPKELIKGNEFCRGGQEIIGVTNRDFVLGKDNDSVSFLLHVGEINNKTHLRELIQEFGRTAIADQPLILSPTMIPGQGIASVTVEASPLLKEKVKLDFLKMSFANDDGKPKTIEYLQKIMPRSYPVDFPEAEASANLWDTYCRDEIRRFMNHNIPPESGCFYHSKFPNAKFGGIEALKRINVFGTRIDAQYPILDRNYLHKVFEKIADEYKKTSDLRYIRLAAWTYRCGVDVFQCIINDVLEKIKKKSKGLPTSLQTEEFSVCANMLSLEEQKFFFQSFNKYVDPIVCVARDNKHRTTISNVDNWIRALLWILIYSNELLKKISSSECNQCMYNLYIIWKNYMQHKTSSTQEIYIRRVICCMLFLLRRRKYDHDFLRVETTPVFGKIMSLQKVVEQESYNLFYTSAKIELANAFFEYLENKGRLDIPFGGLLNDGN